MFDSVSILFSDVVTFTEICSRISPMEVVSMLNGMYSIFDKLTERNKVYKVSEDAFIISIIIIIFKVFIYYHRLTITSVNDFINNTHVDINQFCKINFSL